MAEEIGAPMDLETTVWVGKFVSADEGTLSLRQGMLRFENKNHCLFDSPLQKIQKTVWHWYSFSGAFEAWIDGAGYFVSFVPRRSGLSSWYAGLVKGRQWRAAMEGRAAPRGGPMAAKIFLSLYSLIQAFFLGVAGLFVMMQVTDETNSLWLRIGAGLFVLCILYMIFYLLWQAMAAFIRRDA